jgi:hypothetical protein
MFRRPGRAAKAPVRKTGQKGSTPLDDFHPFSFWFGMICGIPIGVFMVGIALEFFL